MEALFCSTLSFVQCIIYITNLFKKMKKFIDLRSDTVTRPTSEMLKAMFISEVGDDVFGEDPTVNLLEQKAAEIFGMDSGLFCPSGTMANQIAIKAHTQPMDEVICDRISHVYMYEGGGIMFNSGASVKLILGDRGRIKAEDVLSNINPDDVHYPNTRLVCIENTCNRGGGSLYSMEEMEAISKVCHSNTLSFHLDGARIFNAIVETGMKPAWLGNHFDSISVCLSKGLGAPVGSVLLGSKEFIKKSRRIRKVFGGGMRQAGYLASAGLYALDHHIDRLLDDHKRARIIGEKLRSLTYVEEVMPVDTNIIIFTLKESMAVGNFLDYLKTHDILAMKFGPQMIRFVTHLDFTDEEMSKLLNVLERA